MKENNKQICRSCGAPANSKVGGTGRFCSQHKGRAWKDVPFEELKKDGTRKERLLKEFGHRCWECGISEWRGQKAPLQLDHVDGNSDNNNRSNLRILCAMCHALTPTYCGKGKRNNILTKRKIYRNKRNGLVV